MLSVSEALAMVLGQARPLPQIEAPLSSMPLGQVLARPVRSDIDSPPYTKAMMDGFAVRASDCVNAAATLRIIEEVAAGQMPKLDVREGQATRIMTGAPMPQGADAVVMIERTELVPGNQVNVLTAMKPGQNVLQRGEEMRSGDVVLDRGSVLGPEDFGLLATVGHTSVAVFLKPRVAILTTGDEVVEPSDKPGPGQIRNSNGPMLQAQCVRAGGMPLYLGIARDNVEALRSLIATGLRDADVLLLSGGVSAGKFDLVPGVLTELGVVSHFHKVLLKPGKPLLFGVLGEKLVFGLPGNPVSSFVCFELFVRPALRQLNGHTEPGPTSTVLPFAAEFRTNNDRPTYWPARVAATPVGLQVDALPWRGSADLRALRTANALLALPAGQLHYEIKQPVPVILLD